MITQLLRYAGARGASTLKQLESIAIEPDNLACNQRLIG